MPSPIFGILVWAVLRNCCLWGGGGVAFEDPGPLHVFGAIETALVTYMLDEQVDSCLPE